MPLSSRIDLMHTAQQLREYHRQQTISAENYPLKWYARSLHLQQAVCRSLSANDLRTQAQHNELFGLACMHYIDQLPQASKLTIQIRPLDWGCNAKVSDKLALTLVMLARIANSPVRLAACENRQVMLSTTSPGTQAPRWQSSCEFRR